MGFIILPLIIVFIIGYAVYRRTYKRFFDFREHLQIVRSKEDFFTQVFYLMSLFFFGATLFAFNRDLGDILKWQDIILVFSIAALLGAYYLKSFFTLPCGLIAFITWLGLRMGEWTQIRNVKEMVIFSMTMLLLHLWYVLGLIHKKEEKYVRYAFVYRIFSIVGVTGGLFMLSMKDGLREMERMLEGNYIFHSWQVALWVFLVLGAIISTLSYLYSKKAIMNKEIIAVLFGTVFFTALIFLPDFKMFESTGYGLYYSGSRHFTSQGIIWALFFNVLVFVQIVGIILLGYLSREEWLINLGAFFLFILIIVKYFDWFFDFFDKSIFFISAGVLMFLVGGIMEKGRRYMLKEIDNKKEV